MLVLLGWLLLLIAFAPCAWLVINGAYCALTGLTGVPAALSKKEFTLAERLGDAAFVLFGSMALAAVQLVIGLGIPYLILRFMIGAEIVTADELSGVPR